jgi:N-acetylmuramoyl-L-alanine amidase
MVWFQRDSIRRASQAIGRGIGATAVLGLLCFTAACAPAPKAGPLSGKRIVIDPGHNGANATHMTEISRLVDAGGFQKACNTVGTATPAGFKESSVNMVVSIKLKQQLEGLGATVIMTRSDDNGWGPCIDRRGLTATEGNANLLVSIHSDGSNTSTHRGFHVIHPGYRAGYTDATRADSKRLATSIRDSLVNSGHPKANYVGTQGLHERTDLGTLNRAGRPAVLVEMGNLKHAGDAALLVSNQGQDQMATAIASGIRRYLGG